MTEEPRNDEADTDRDELLIDGQEEVFSRTEVERGRIEHATEAGGKTHAPPPRPPGAPDR
jgi:hypothetical protein